MNRFKVSIIKIGVPKWPYIIIFENTEGWDNPVGYRAIMTDWTAYIEEVDKWFSDSFDDETDEYSLFSNNAKHIFSYRCYLKPRAAILAKIRFL